jgi:tRNA-dihydrouridine synthase
MAGNIYKSLGRPFFVLAPMEDVTDSVFRRVVADCSKPDLFFTEFVNVEGLQSVGRPKVIHRLQFTEKESPLIAQIWGKNPESYYKTAKELADGTLAHESSGLKDVNYAGIDINMGCPEKSVVKNGCCVALINDRPLAKEIVQAVKEGAGGKLPVSVKTRLGFNEVDFSWHEFLLGQGIDALTVHGRTKKQMSKVPADWELIGRVRQIRDDMGLETAIIGNGDVESRAQGVEYAEKYGLDGIMIGRGVFSDPFVFAQKSSWESTSKEDKIKLYKNHAELFGDTWSEYQKRTHLLNKFCKIYINDFPGANELRKQLMDGSDVPEIVSILEAELQKSQTESAQLA